MIRETCHCGHDKASHYEDNAVQPPIVRTCLCRGCDCLEYRHESTSAGFWRFRQVEIKAERTVWAPQ